MNQNLRKSIIFLLNFTFSCSLITVERRPQSIVSLKEESIFSPDGKFFCSGSILSKFWIITAGHCFTDKIDSETIIYADVGSEYRSNGTRYKVSKYYIHPNQSSSIEIIKNDLCLLKVDTPIEFSLNVQPAKIGTIKDQKELSVIASGWGRESQHGSLHKKLRFLNFKTLKYEMCKKIHAKKKNIVDRETHICVYGGRGKSLCFGDSGGPLIDEATGNLVGVFSGLEDCTGEYPLLFMRIESYIHWINNVTQLELSL